MISHKATLLEPAGDVRGVVAYDYLRPGSLYTCKRLQNRPLLVQPAVLRCGLEHRVLAAHVVGSDGEVRHLAHPTHDVEVRERGLDHDNVRALFDIQGNLAQSFASVRGVHLVAAPVPKLRGALGSLPER